MGEFPMKLIGKMVPYSRRPAMNVTFGGSLLYITFNGLQNDDDNSRNFCDV